MSISIDLIRVLISENQEKMARSPFVKREILAKLFQPQKDLVSVIQGVRRSGKSTLLYQIAEKLNILGTPQSVFLNFEDPRLGEEMSHTLLEKVREVGLANNPDRPVYFFFDAIQNVKLWEKWLHIQLERPKNCYFIVTGSNAALLGGKMASALTGRHLSYELFPFSFPEFLEMFPTKGLEDFLNLGGFPRAIQSEDPNQLLREYFVDIIQRDVRQHVAARSEVPLVQVAKAVDALINPTLFEYSASY